MKKSKLRKILLELIAISCLVLIFIFAGKIGDRLFPLKDNFGIVIKDGKIGKGDSLYKALTRDFSIKETISLSKALSEKLNTKHIKPGDSYKVYSSTSGNILKFIYMPSPLLNYVADRSTYGFIVSKFIPETEEKLAAVKGVINSSLYGGMQNCGIETRMIMNFTEIFQWQIDFFTEVRPGDRFQLVFKRYYLDGEPVENGSIIAALYKGHAGNLTAIRFNDGELPDYYNSEGESFRKQFLKAPLNYKRISSYFSLHRMHPILKIVRPHYGIDYAAPTGTPVSSIGNGKVVFVGWENGYGKTVIVKHNSIYTSHYGHLSRYAKGINKGVNVKQGQLIGYVGMTGLATGPHLDFKIERYGKPVNFLKLKLPAAKSVSTNNKEIFNKKVDEIRNYIKYLESDFFEGSVGLIEDYLEQQNGEALLKTGLPE
ncbi:MAG: peptidoglycan DD-metalloendopeptidase family protein [Elusimicrobiota bacterium]